MSCLTKLLNLLCLKCLGSTSAASCTGSATMSERPSGAHSMQVTCGELTSSNLCERGRTRSAESGYRWLPHRGALAEQAPCDA